MDWNPRGNLGPYRRVRGRGRVLFRLAVTLGWLLVIGATLAFGYGLARHDAAEALASAEALRAEVASLSEALARGREERLRLARAHQMDREAKRQAQQSLAELQRERLLLSKRVTYLQRLLQDGRQGVVEVKEFQLRKGLAPGHYGYRMILSQLVPQNERTRGRALLRVAVTVGGEEQILSLDALPGSSAAEVALDFEHFQAVSGDIVLPDGAEPERLIVEIEPDPGSEGASLARSAEAFLWPEAAEAFMLPTPVFDARGLVEQLEVE
ncbi:MAG: DUF6776 family protein [Halochromatium sp.]